MKLNKNIIIILAFSLIVVLGLNSCLTLMDENYSQLVASQFDPTASDLGSLLGPAYGNWRELAAHREGWRGSQELPADAIVIPARPNGWVDGGIFRRLHEHRWTEQDPNPRRSWNASYSGITNTNRVIFQIESGLIPISEGKENVLAELRALRASYYYVLLDLFGNVPIVTRFDVEEGFVPEQSSRSQVYNFVVNEILEVLPHLSDEVNQTTYARFNRWAALSLLAKIYLNAEIYSGTAEWGKCLAICEEIINSNKYIMANSQKDVFITNNHNSPEIIFAIPFDEIYATGFNIHRETLQPANQATYNFEGAPFGGSCAIPQFIDTYDPDDDRLKDNWIKGQQYSFNGVPLRGSFRAFNGELLAYINAIPRIDSTEEVHGYRQGKYEFRIGARNNLSNDIPLFRYTDILMMKAECLLRTGNSSGAAEIVTQVRSRSFINNPAKASVTGEDLMKGSAYKYGIAVNNIVLSEEGGADIPYGRFLDELGWEFSQESRRRQDLIRFGVFTKKSWLSHSPVSDDKKLFPIPLHAMNTNPNLKQNPGY